MTPLLEVQDLHVWFEDAAGNEIAAVRGVDLEIDAADRVGLVGESGCGKSTTILAIMGLLPSNATVAGRVLLDGEEILAGGDRTIRPHRWRDIAMVFQGAMNAFNPVRPIGVQIADAVQIRGGRTRKEAAERARELLELVGIPRERAGGFPHQFSGGMRQRAAIALALACEPRILLADEPTTALDVMVQAQIMLLLEHLCSEQGLALLLVSHDLSLVLDLCPRMNVMYAGEIIERGPSDALADTPTHPYTRLMFAATPDIFDESPLASIPGAPPSLDREIVGCPFQPRCDRAFERCVNETPVLKHSQEEQEAACHLNDLGRKASPDSSPANRTTGVRNGAA
ncbi:MAG TPA: ABC transporter ATP-binding protein [Solirubrobacteraceae bacterium]|nr:ABC transporter ATP-binding protein [Solirubrobacteraceae bacterium]